MKPNHDCQAKPCLECEQEKDREMWLGIAAGIIGLQKAITFTLRSTPALGMASSALVQISNAIKKRWWAEGEPSALDQVLQGQVQGNTKDVD